MEHHLQIYGITWGGFRACHQYTVRQDQANVLATGDGSEVRRIAGDFQSVDDWRLVSEANTYANNRRETVWKTLRGFHNGMTPRRFNRLINGFS